MPWHAANRLLQLARTFQPIPRPLRHAHRVLHPHRAMSAAAASSSSSPLAPPLVSSPLFRLHQFARSENKAYPKRQHVPDDMVPWHKEWKEYAPPDFTAEGPAKKSDRPPAHNGCDSHCETPEDWRRWLSTRLTRSSVFCVCIQVEGPFRLSADPRPGSSSLLLGVASLPLAVFRSTPQSFRSHRPVRSRKTL